MKLKKIRLEQNLTQQELAEMLGVSRQCIIYWENEERIIPVKQAKKIATILGIKWCDLYD